jgi:hypothetical protein
VDGLSAIAEVDTEDGHGHAYNAGVDGEMYMGDVDEGDVKEEENAVDGGNEFDAFMSSLSGMI